MPFKYLTQLIVKPGSLCVTKLRSEMDKVVVNKTSRSRLVFVLYPFQGHINPMLQLASIFHQKGYLITIVHPEFNSPNPSNHPHFTFLSVPDKLIESNVSLAPKDFMTLVLVLNKNCVAPLQNCLKQMLDEKQCPHGRERIACVIYDGLMYFAQTVANDFGLPGISMRPTAASFLLPFFIPQSHRVSFFENQIPELEPLQLNQIYMVENPTEASLEARAASLNAAKRSLGMISNTMEFLEHSALSKLREYYPAPVYTIGPFHKLAPSTTSTSLLTEDAHCISWLHKQAPKSVIYVSFGSMANLSDKDIVEIAWGLANSEQPFLWVIRPGLVLGSGGSSTKLLLPEGFQEEVGERGCIVKWAPQREVLQHEAVGGFLTHCGWNSTLESVSEGVPMLCRPCFGDQFMNMRYICYVWKIGLELGKELEREKIKGAIKKLMVGVQGEDIRNKAMELKEKTELCLKEGGSSSSSLDEFTKKILSF